MPKSVTVNRPITHNRECTNPGTVRYPIIRVAAQPINGGLPLSTAHDAARLGIRAQETRKNANGGSFDEFAGQRPPTDHSLTKRPATTRML